MRRGIRPYYWWEARDSINTNVGGLIGAFTHLGTSRTRVNPVTGLVEAVGAGVGRIESAGGHLAWLCEPGPAINRCHDSQDFLAATSVWTNTNCTVTVNDTTAPDGADTADKIVEATDVGQVHGVQVTIAQGTWTNDASVTFAVYAKKGTRDWIKVWILTKANAWVGASFNLNTGATGTETVDSLGIEEAANGFYRCWITHDINTGVTDTIFQVDIGEADDDVTYNGDGSYVYLWQVDIVEQPVVTSAVVTSGADDARNSESGEPHWTLPTGLFDAEGTAIIWWRPGYASSAGAGYGILSSADALGFLYNDLDGTVKTYDNTTAADVALLWSADTWYKLIAKWGYDVGGTEKKRIGVDSGAGVVWGAEADFDGSYTLDTYLRIGYSLFSRMHVRELMLFRSVLDDTMISHYSGSP